MTTQDFAELLRGARDGHEPSFTSLFRCAQPILVRYLRTIAASEMVDDLASDTWVSVVRGLDRFEGDDAASFYAWLLTMARRRWVDELRRRGRRLEAPYESDSLKNLASGQPIETELDIQISESPTLALLKGLPPDQAEVVLLRVVSGLDVERVAAIVGKSAGAVRVLSHRGLRRLERLLETSVTDHVASTTTRQR